MRFRDAFNAIDMEIPHSVADLAELKSLPIRPLTVLPRGGQAQGMFRWNAGSAATANDGTIVQPTSGPAGRYERVYDFEITPVWFGADPTGIADSLAAFNAATVAGNGSIRIPPGTFKLSGQWLLNGYAHTSIKGVGRGNAKLVFSAGGLVVQTTAPPYVGTESNHTLRDIMICTTANKVDTAVIYRCSPGKERMFVVIDNINIVGANGMFGTFNPIVGTTHTSTLVDGIASTAAVQVNDQWIGTGIPTNAYVVSKTANSVTLNQAATSSTTDTFFYYRGTDQAWLHGIKLDTCWHTNINNVSIWLQSIGYGGKGIEITGANSEPLFDYEWSGINIWGAEISVAVNGWVEGLYITNSNFYVCRDALVMQHGTNPLVGTMGFVNCAFTCSRTPVQTNFVHSQFYIGCQFYKAFAESAWMPAGAGRLESNGEFWYPGSAVDITVSATAGLFSNIFISNSIVYAAFAVNSPAIKLTNCQNFTINNVQAAFGTWSDFFDFNGNTSGQVSEVSLNTVTLTGTLLNDTSSAQVHMGRVLIDGVLAYQGTDAREPFSANDATPSVKQTKLKSRFYTANAAPTTITQFDDGRIGQTWTVVINDGNTTFQHNANLLLRGGVNFAAVTGDVLHFVQEGATYARETARSTENLRGNNITVVTATVGGLMAAGGAVTSATYIKPGTTTVGALPAAGTAGVGAMMMVTDANATTAAGIGTAVVGGGVNVVQVTSNGTVWYISG